MASRATEAAAAEPPSTTTTSVSAVVCFSLPIFLTLQKAQNEHGIPIADYGQYHEYCTNKLFRLRHNNAVKTQLVHNHKYHNVVEGGSGGGRHHHRRHAYCPRKQVWKTSTDNKEGEENGDDNDGDNENGGGEEEEQDATASTPAAEAAVPTHENIFWNVFFQAERCWAQACEYQHQQQKNKIHRHVQRRLNKAEKFAQEFHDLILKFGDEQTKLESRAYLNWIQGNTALEHKRYAQAFRHLKTGMQLLHELATNKRSGATSSSTVEDLTICDIWTTRADTILRPLVRYCQYEAKDALSADEILQEEPSRTSVKKMKGKSSITLSFQGKDIALDEDASYQQIAVLFLKMEEFLKQPTSLNENQSVQLLSDLEDALQIVHDERRKYDSIASPGPAVTAKLEELNSMDAFFEYQRRSIWALQQEERITTLAGPADKIHMYTALQENATQMADLCIDEDDTFRLEAQAHVLRIRALRCYQMAELFDQNNASLNEVLALLDQSQKLTKRAMEEIAACDDVDESYLTGLEDLQRSIKILTCRTEATKFLEKHMNVPKPNNRPLWMRLDTMEAGTVLADDPLRPIPIPCKGVFYDIAGQYIRPPTHVIEAHIAELRQEQTKQQKSGFFSWFGS